jgi:hypothetical protein
MELMRRLPDDIISYIIPFTYSPQSTILLSDIKNFTEKKKIITKIYGDKYEDLLPYETNGDMNWLVSDIIMYTKMNNRNLYRTFAYMYNDFIFTKKNIFSQFNIFWSHLSIDERNSFVRLRSK